MFDNAFYSIRVDITRKIRMFSKNNLSQGFMLSFLAGIYIGFGLLLSMTVGGLLKNTCLYKIGMGVTFGIGLLLVIFCGAELFTGNNLIIGISWLKRHVTCYNVVNILAWCLLGNLIGSIVLGKLFIESGLCTGITFDIIKETSITKVNLSPDVLVVRGILCNMLVCLAIWSVKQLKNEAAKIIMVSWSLFAFVTCGFEHSIANMSLLYIAYSQEVITLLQMLYNLSLVVVGNVIGGFIIAFAYTLVDCTRRDDA